MPYCGTQWVPAGTTCPNGQPATAGKNGAPAKPAANASQSTGDSGWAWNQDTTPVQVGTKPGGNQNFTPGDGSVLKLVPIPNTMPVAEARELFNEIRGKGTAKGASAEDRQAWQALVSGLRGYTGSELGTRGSQEDAWAKVLKDASRAGVDVNDLLYGKAGSAGSGRGGSGSGGSGGGYSGPRVSTQSSATVTDAVSASALLNDMAVDLLGRNLSEKEIEKYTKRLNKQEAANPATSRTVSQSGAAASASSTVQTTAPDKQEIMRQLLSKNPDYMKFQVDTTVMDMFVDRIKRGQEVANG